MVNEQSTVNNQWVENYLDALVSVSQLSINFNRASGLYTSCERFQLEAIPKYSMKGIRCAGYPKSKDGRIIGKV